MIEKEYLSNRVSLSSNIQLVELVYEALIHFLETGAEGIKSHNIKMTDKGIHKSREILAELLSTVSGNSEIAASLRSIYVYLNKLITEAGNKKDYSKLDEAIKVVMPLYEAWQELAENDNNQNSINAGPAVIAGITYGKGQLNDYVINDKNRWEKG